MEQTSNKTREQLAEDFIVNPEKTLFALLTDFQDGMKVLQDTFAGVDISELRLLKGEPGVDGYNPEFGKDYMTDEDFAAIQEYVLGLHRQLVATTATKAETLAMVKKIVGNIPKPKDGKSFAFKDLTAAQKAELKGKDGSPDTGKQILSKIRKQPKGQGFKMADVEGLVAKLNSLTKANERIDELRSFVEKSGMVTMSSTPGGGESGVSSFSGDYNDLTNKPDLSAFDDVVAAADLASFPATGETGFLYIAEDTGLVYRWSGSAYASISGTATATISPYFVAASDASPEEIAQADYVCDGTADDVQINQAIADMVTNGAAGRVVLSSGRFNLAASIVLEGIEHGMALQGQGWGTVLVLGNGVNDYAVKVNPSETTAFWGDLHDFKIEGNAANQTAGGGIRVYFGKQVSVSRIWVNKPYDWGINFESTVVGNFGSGCTARDCIVDGGNESGGVGGGVHIRYHDEITVTDCEMSFLGGSSLVYDGITFQTVGVVDRQGLNKIIGNEFVHLYGGVHIQDAGDTIVAHNMFDRLEGYSLYIKGEPVQVSNNTFYRFGELFSGGPGTNSGTAIGLDFYCNANIVNNIFRTSENNGESARIIDQVSSGNFSAAGNLIITGNKVKISGTLGTEVHNITTLSNATIHSNFGFDEQLIDGEEIFGAGAGAISTEVITTDTTAEANKRYITDSASLITISVPATLAAGSVIEVVGSGAGGWKVQANTGQTILTSAETSGIAGNVTSTNRYDAATFVCIGADTTLSVTPAGTIDFNAAVATPHSLKFDGVNDKATVANNSNYKGLVAGTIDFKAKAPSTFGSFKKLLRTDGIDIGINSGGELFGEIGGVANMGVLQSGFNNNTWRDVRVTWNASNIYAYVDGVQVFTAASGGTQGTGSGALNVGFNGSEYFDGWLDRIRIKSVATIGAYTPDAADFVSDADTVLLLNLNEGVGSTSADASGNGNDLTLDATNPPTWSTDVDS